MDEMKVKVEGGYLVVTPSCDPEYPGVDIEFESDVKGAFTKPRVLIEKPNSGKLRALLWADPSSEDFTVKVEFKVTPQVLSEEVIHVAGDCYLEYEVLVYEGATFKPSVLFLTYEPYDQEVFVGRLGLADCFTSKLYDSARDLPAFKELEESELKELVKELKKRGAFGDFERRYPKRVYPPESAVTRFGRCHDLFDIREKGERKLYGYPQDDVKYANPVLISREPWCP